MRRFSVLCVVLLSLSAPVWADEKDLGPHQMVGADGKPDPKACLVCHQEDMSLSLSKAETCTLCHAASIHAGAEQHLRAAAASVARLIGATGATLPLTEDGRIYCGTCHVFHDPAISGEKALATPWVPARAGLPEAVRQSLIERWNRAAAERGEAAPGATFTTEGTTRLRLPIDDGTLCRQCHGYGK